MGIKKELQLQFDADIIEDFLDHFSVMIDVMEPLVFKLKKPELYTQSVNELFRIFHNIKSASGFLKLDMMQRLSILVEEILEEMRNLDHLLNEEVIDWLLKVVDMYRQWNEELHQDTELSKVSFRLTVIPDVEKY